MINLKRVLLVLLICTISSMAALTIHVQNPWRAEAEFNSELRIYGIAELGWSADAAKLMTPEGSDWYTIDITTEPKTSTRNLSLVRRKGNSWTYDTKSISNLNTLFSSAKDEELHVWISFKDKDDAGTSVTDPIDAGATLIYFLNPWPETSSKLVIKTNTQQMLIDTDHDGWYKGFTFADRASLTLSFEEYFGSSFYNSLGKTDDKDGAPIDLTPYKDSGQILYIWPDPRPVGPPKIATKFPNIFGAAPFRTITAIVRDQKADGIEFEMTEGNDNVVTGMVQENLVDGKIKKGAVTYKSDGLESWFETKIISTDKTNDTCIDIEMRKTDNGGWEFNSDWYGGFFPIDDFNPHNDTKLASDDGKLHNFHFTMELHTQFDYHEGQKQIFSFTGDDDVWVFINGKLAIDLGAPHPPKSGSIQLDTIKNEYNLEDGKTYNLDMFYCERRTTGSNFKMNTTFNLRNQSSLFYDSTLVNNVLKYKIKELVSGGDLDDECGFNVYDSTDYDTVSGVVDFLITGPYFSEADTLKSGTNFGGIVVEGDTMISIDTAKITDLTNGEYTISFISKHNKSLTGYITFYLNRLEKASLEAYVGSTKLPAGDTTVYATLILPVTLKSDTTCTIYYKVDGGSTQTFNESGSVDISGDTVTLKAWALSATNNFLPSDTVTWYFVRNLPQLSLKADPGDGTTFVSDTTVHLTVLDKGGQTVSDAKIYYLIDKKGDGTYPDSTAGTLYSGAILVDTSLTIWAIAYHKDYIEVQGKWRYEIDLSASWTKLITSYQTETNSGTIYFGKSVEFTLETNCDTLQFTTDGTDPKSGTLYKGSTISIDKDSPDSIDVKSYVFGHGFNPATHTFTLLRDTLPELVADTSADPFCAFKGSLNVTLDLSKTPEVNRWKAVKIYYTLDGAAPDSTKTLYDGPVKIDKTLTLKAIAYSINALESPILDKDYIKVSTVTQSWYSDQNGDGQIDKISFRLSHEPEKAPNSITVINPFDPNESIQVKKDMTLSGTLLTASFTDDQFSFETQSTSFDQKPLAVIQGDYFLADSISVADSVAPVVLRGKLRPGEIKQPVKGINIERYKDTLEVYYSEEVKIGTTESPYFVKGADDNYLFELSNVTVNSNKLIGIIEKTDGGFPTIGEDQDSLRILIESQTEDLRGNRQRVTENRFGPLEVLEPKYLLIVTAIGPFNPDSAEAIPDAFFINDLAVEKAQISVADFLMTIKNPQLIDGSMVIFDKVGNEVLSLKGKEQSNERIGCYLADTEDRTRFIFYWNGQNSQGRVVGSGSYQAQYLIKTPSGEIEKRSDIIGIRRSVK